jgi:DNA-directed RNA polymerase subunit alpha
MHLNWTTLINSKLDIAKESDDGTFGKFEVEPLERGYGITLGNALRRTLLSSLRGAAVTGFRVDGVLHEMGTIQGVVEDVTEVVLNLKGVRLAMPDGDPVNILLQVDGDAKEERVVTGADLQVPAGVQVLNPSHHILTLAAKGSVRMELEAETGRGYVPGDQLRREGRPVDWVTIDALYSPIRRVTYKVTDARVGQRTDYDKLMLELHTDGSVAPADAVALAAKILKTQLQVFINFDEPSDDKETPTDTTPEEEWNEHLFRSVDELDLSVRAANCLQNANIKYVYELVERTESDMLKTKNFGRKSLMEIQRVLAEMELQLGMKLPKSFPRKR